MPGSILGTGGKALHKISKVSIFLDSEGEGAKGRKGGTNALCLSLKKKSPQGKWFQIFLKH